jgi:hypothetical protein
VNGAGSVTLPALGKVLQVLESQQSSQIDISTTNVWTDIGLSVSIQPSSINSKFIITTASPFRLIATTGFMRGSFRLVRDSTVIYNTQGYKETYQVRDANNEWNSVAHIIDFDYPATTSSITYKVQAVLQEGSTFRIYSANYGTRIIVQEIGA